MIRAIIFDLDGTLVQTETLKAQSYAQAAVSLSRDDLSEREVIEAFKEVVGLSRQEVAQFILDRFDLQEAARLRTDSYYVQTPWQAFVQVRMKIYASMLEDSLLIVKNRCPYALDLLVWARENGFKTGLATMSHCEQAARVLHILDTYNDFDFIATRDDINNGKPDPEIYRLVCHELGVNPSEGLVVEDSATGIQAALSAGMPCVAVTSDYTRQRVRAGGLLDPRWIVDDPYQLKKTVQNIIKAHA